MVVSAVVAQPSTRVEPRLGPLSTHKASAVAAGVAPGARASISRQTERSRPRALDRWHVLAVFGGFLACPGHVAGMRRACGGHVDGMRRASSGGRRACPGHAMACPVACRWRVRGVPRAWNGMFWHVLAGDGRARTRRKAMHRIVFIDLLRRSENQDPWPGAAPIRNCPPRQRLRDEDFAESHGWLERHQGLPYVIDCILQSIAVGVKPLRNEWWRAGRGRFRVERGPGRKTAVGGMRTCDTLRWRSGYAFSFACSCMYIKVGRSTLSTNPRHPRKTICDVCRIAQDKRI